MSCRDIENIIKNAYSISQRVGSEDILEIAILDEIAIKERARIRKQRQQEEMIRQGRRTPIDSCNGDDDVEYEFVSYPVGPDAAAGMGQLQLEPR